MGDDAEDRRRRRGGCFGQAGHPLGLGEALGGGAAGLHEDEPAQHQAGLAGGGVAIEMVVAGALGRGDLRHGGQPIVVHAGRRPEVDVAIDQVHGSGVWEFGNASRHQKNH